MEKINIQTLENGETFTRHGCGTNSHYREISKEEYERVTAIEGWQGKLDSEYRETMSDAIRWGYGFYGCNVCQIEDKYYYSVCIGNSCD